MAETEKRESRIVRYWKFLIYQDSCGGGWITDDDYEGLVDRLEETGVQLFLSPIHNRDLGPDGNFKKAHMHVLAYFPGKKSYNNVVSLFSDFGVKHALVCDDNVAAEQYWAHLNCRNKATKPEYPIEDCIALNGYKASGLGDKKTQNDVTRTYQLVEEKGILYLCDLGSEIIENHYELFNSFKQLYAFWDRYLQSRERIVAMVRKRAIEKDVPITSLMSSYKTYRIRFGMED